MCGLMTFEEKRFLLQQVLDEQKDQLERNKLGQFSTPYRLARKIVEYAVGLLPDGQPLSMLEPACGTGVFFSALQDVAGTDVLKGSLGFEIDSHYYSPTVDLWKDAGLEVVCSDFLSQPVSRRFPLLIANPPYTRHHHIPSDIKNSLQNAVREQTGLSLSGLTGLYGYFMLLSSRWLADDAISCWLIPSEFMDVNYGSVIKEYLLTQVELLRIHRFDENDLQFSDALVSSAVVVFRNARPSSAPVQLTYGNDFSCPLFTRELSKGQLANLKKWNRLFVGGPLPEKTVEKTLGDFFTVKRGIATGCNSFFIVNQETIREYGIPEEYLTPILPSPRKLKRDIVSVDSVQPLSDPLFLFSTTDSKAEIQNKYPSVMDYIRKGEDAKVHETYICSRHTPWYACERRESAPYVIPYMGRGEKGERMFRFILNESNAIATNGYLLLYPKKEYKYLFNSKDFSHEIWKMLNDISSDDFLQQGRFYGGGLHKIEPRELLNIPARGIGKLLAQEIVWVA